MKQMLLLEGWCEQILDRTSTSVRMVDDCGIVWECIMIFGTDPHEHCSIGGQWKRFVEARILTEGVRIRLANLLLETTIPSMCKTIVARVGIICNGIWRVSFFFLFLLCFLLMLFKFLLNYCEAFYVKFL